MHKQRIIIEAPHGIHTRPAALLVRHAQQFLSDIVVVCKQEEANAKSLFKLQMLDLSHGQEVEIRAQGEDAELAVTQLISLLKTLS